MIAQATATASTGDAVDDAAHGPTLVDTHCHCLAGLDDGPRTLDQAIGLCEVLVAEGVRDVIATPHQLGRYERTIDGPVIRQAVASLNQALGERGSPLVVHPGGEVRIDERLVSLLEEDTALTLGDQGTHVLVELPHEVAINPLPLIEPLAERRITVLISHPERLGPVIEEPELAQRWHEAGAQLQITAGSLLGDFGGTIRRAAWNLIQNDAVTLVASDAHDARRRPPRLRRAFERLAAVCDQQLATRLCVTNPRRLLSQPVAERANEPALRPGLWPGIPRQIGAWPWLAAS